MFEPTVRINGKLVKMSSLKEKPKVEPIIKTIRKSLPSKGSRHGKYADLDKRKAYMRNLMRLRRLKDISKEEKKE